jgi:hypothetical protein
MDDNDSIVSLYLNILVSRMDTVVGINYAAAVMEEGTHRHIHTIFWSAKKITFDYTKKLWPGIHHEDAGKRLSQNLDYLYKRNGYEEKGHTNRSQVVEYGEYPVTDASSGPSEWIAFINAGHNYLQLINVYPDALGRAYGLRVYIKELDENERRRRRESNN